LDNKIQIKPVILCVPGQLRIQSRISLCTTNWMKQKNPLPVSAGHALCPKWEISEWSDGSYQPSKGKTWVTKWWTNFVYTSL